MMTVAYVLLTMAAIPLRTLDKDGINIVVRDQRAALEAVGPRNLAHQKRHVLRVDSHF